MNLGDRRCGARPNSSRSARVPSRPAPGGNRGAGHGLPAARATADLVECVFGGRACVTRSAAGCPPTCQPPTCQLTAAESGPPGAVPDLVESVFGERACVTRSGAVSRCRARQPTGQDGRRSCGIRERCVHRERSDDTRARDRDAATIAAPELVKREPEERPTSTRSPAKRRRTQILWNVGRAPQTSQDLRPDDGEPHHTSPQRAGMRSAPPPAETRNQAINEAAGLRCVVSQPTVSRRYSARDPRCCSS